MNISWTPPEPRSGLKGPWDRFVGPGTTRAEYWLQVLVPLLAGAGIPIYALMKNLGWSTGKLIIAGLLAADLFGGVLTNATSTAKRWYHREGQGPAQHMAFVALHGVHIFLVAWLFRSMDWRFFAVFFGYLLAGCLIVTLTPLYLQRPVALVLYCGVILVYLFVFEPMPGMDWFVPVLFLKLMISHLLKEAPFRPETGPTGRSRWKKE